MLRTLKDENRLVYVIEHDASPVGIVRFDRTATDQSQAEVGIYLLPPYLHKGIGSFALQKAILMMLQRWPNLQRVKAKVRSDNTASIGFFKKFSFQTQKTPNQPPQEDLINLEASVEDLLKIINKSFYGRLVRSHQLSFKSLNWGSEESQNLRFRILSEFGNFSNAKLLDLGCGTGDFLKWLTEHQINVYYTGIDISEEMINVARNRFSAARFLVGDISSPELEESYDIIVESGIFTISTQHIFFDTLRRAFEKCTVGVAFNALSAWSPQKEEGECYLDPAVVLDFCKSLTRRVTLRHDYHPRDFTVYLYKQ